MSSPSLAVSVGDTIINPVTGENEVVLEVLDDGVVYTDKNHGILTQTAVNTQYVVGGKTYKIVSTTTNATTGLIETIHLENVADSSDTLTQSVLTDGDIDGGGAGAPGDSGGPVTIQVPAGNVHVVTDYQMGPRGSNGSDGGGIRICFFGCFTIGIDAEEGDPGQPGPNITRSVTAGNNGDITSITNGLSGITVISQGGNGGDGGDGWGVAVDGAQGGPAGVGGAVNLTNEVMISTSGDGAHGIFAQSRGGIGGDGGEGYILSGGGTGGPASAGGSVTVINSGNIEVRGLGSVGLFAQSIGGGGGSGGSSYGLVGNAGSASVGGHGANVTVTNTGNITTHGAGGHGIQAQSVGGTGGNGGNAGGIAALGGAPLGGGGNGGAVEVRNNGTASILTLGEGAHGIFAQSVGGGGGDAGTVGGLVALGADGAIGGNGANVTVITQSGTSVETRGANSHGIFAQSVGGGGGSGGGGGGFVALGADGGSGGNGGGVTVDNAGRIKTGADGSRGIFAQSVGGGGGSASGIGGGFSLGGGGSGGGFASTVDVINSGLIQTAGEFSDGIFAQSVGGGGGSGADSGGAISIGGGGSTGGAGGDVVVRNTGNVFTGEQFSRAIFAQSVGGGGGSGGHSGGVISIGGGGSAASNAGTVRVTNSGTLFTRGDLSSGIQAQSVGGGGGDGGTSGGLVSIGGKGDSGGNAGAVYVTNSGNIVTLGNDSHGIFAQAVGGGGGSGGGSYSGSAFAGASVGGNGGKGGDGGNVTVTLQPNGTDNAAISTSGDRSRGIFAQSVGGGGGSGGSSVQASAGAYGALSIAVGGRGGAGGNAGKVNVSGLADITTHGMSAHGIQAQSVGGGGGNGGYAISVAVAGGTGAAGAGSFAIGGEAGDGGTGGTVTVATGGSISTSGDFANGFLAQSVGGGGGNGGFAVSVAASGSGGFSGALALGIGGRGGGGKAGGTVDASHSGNITTSGLDADAFVAQSIGGGGGSGGFSVSVAGAAGGGAGSGTVSVGVGGSGGNGGAGGAVTAGYGGQIVTMGDQAGGFLAQSVGGGGGSGGFSVSVAASGSTGVSGNLPIGVGGSGGGGGDAGAVVATIGSAATPSSITTYGSEADGIVVQSVGGGGGNGGFNVSAGFSAGTSGAGSLAVGVGGVGGDGGGGSNVSATIYSDVSTGGDANGGDRSTAILLQSIGGGGGNGGFNVTGSVALSNGNAGSVGVGVGGSGGGGGNAGTVTATVTGDISTNGANASGLVAQSLGGGGGNGGFNVTGGITASAQGGGGVGVGVGGSGGSGGDAAGVDLTYTGDITARGSNANALIAQSVGGGGGSGGFSVSGGIALSQQQAGAIGVSVGGSGGGGGDAGQVTLRATGDITAVGAGVNGAVAQSIGGGGGNGGFSVDGQITLTKGASGAMGVNVGGSGGDGGSAAAVSSTLTGNIITSGDDAVGFRAQSIGGGGGNGGFSVAALTAIGVDLGGAISVGVGGSGGGGGDAGGVTATLTGDVTTHGARSGAFEVQSVGGGGGNGGFDFSGAVGIGTGVGDFVPLGLSGALAVGIGGKGGDGGNAGNVTATATGDLMTDGDASIGALVQSVGGGGGNGGFNFSAAVALGKGTAGGATVGVGGFGGAGGDAGTVDAVLDGAISTHGAGSAGVLVQSVGGGGGNGGFNASAGLAVSGSDGSGLLGIGVGGFGGGGGNAGDVTLTRTGVTQTNGLDSDALTVQSVAGGGGNGGINVTGNVSFSSKAGAYAAAIGIGGFGGDGGDAGSASATVNGDVLALGSAETRYVVEDIYEWDTTQFPPVAVRTGGLLRRITEHGSGGIRVQSIGGGGGNGGINVSGSIALTGSGASNAGALNLGIGGFGGAGGNAGSASLDLTASLVSAIGDDKSAVVVQSIGGGGGDGGINVSGGITTGGSVQLGIGGFGGGGGRGRHVTALVTSDVVAYGNNARGIIAQSVGGGGGNGAINVSGGIGTNSSSSLPSFNFGIGGYGGAGNASDDVNLRQTGNVVVTGVDSVGVIAQSIAGGGGSGGLNVSGAVNLGASTGIGIGIGGSGGTGADAGSVSLTSNGNISVDGRGATLAEVPASAGIDPDLVTTSLPGRGQGIVAQSIGGGGGHGGLNVTGIITPQATRTVTVGVGGSGGSGGDGGDVVVVRGNTVAGRLETWGDKSTGLLVQSIGGGGGDAGMNFVTNLGNMAEGAGAYAANISLGGSGGAAGNAGTATVTHTGDIVTHGDKSIGLSAQSVGGGGGNAGINLNIPVTRKATTIDLALGGGTGAGGLGGDVTVAHAGNIGTEGDASDAILAQSVGGGGGNTALNMSFDMASSRKINIAIGRTGGTGGDGGDVSVTSNGTLLTLGDQSTGIAAQSIGGGGGRSGSITVAGSMSGGAGADKFSNSGRVSVGLEGASGGVGGTVEVTASGAISTAGRESYGIFAQSVGGGGGAGGDLVLTNFAVTNTINVGVGGGGGAGGRGGSVTVANRATVTTSGADAHGVWAQSIGGGGGRGGSVLLGELNATGASANGANTISVSVGGHGGDGADGGVVVVGNAGSIETTGEGARGIRAQSIGGGGGDGGAVLRAALNAAAGDTHDLNVMVGGTGGDGGTGNTVTVTNTGVVITRGDRGIGISAESIGGGGGDGGLVAEVAVAARGVNQQVGLTIGGAGGSGGVGGDVTVTNRPGSDGEGGVIFTLGDDAYGIHAQSIGGGGGNGSSVISGAFAGGTGDTGTLGLTIGGKGGSGNNAGVVTATNDGVIETRGDRAYGIFAQSIGGGGGNGGIVLAANLVRTETGNSALLNVGGSGGGGGNGGNVIVNNTGTIETTGAFAHGIFAQSIAGGGGNAGVSILASNKTVVLGNLLSAGIGAASGGSAGTVGAVTVSHTGNISVLGEGAEIIKTESVAGGGGSLALDFDGIVSLPGVPFVHDDDTASRAIAKVPAGASPVTTIAAINADPNGTVISSALGSTVGLVGQSGGAVSSTTAGEFASAADNGTGIAGGSIGGGGGTYTNSFSFLPGDVLNDYFGIDLRLGGGSGSGNKGGNTTIAHDGSILTTGTSTPGVIAQSIGGGGGRGAVVVDGRGQSYGATRVALGAVGSTGESGGDVSVTIDGDLATTGRSAPGVIVQSIGGGGGSFGFADLTASGNSDVDASLGADGGSGHAGGAASFTQTGAVVTTGANSTAVLVQSIGAGGGNVRASSVGSVASSLGGGGNASGDGGMVTITHDGAVVAAGERAHGILAQSIGGGGGAVLHDATTTTLALSAANAGDGGHISITQDGNVHVHGNESIGILAQSIGGGGGFVDGIGVVTAGGDGSGGTILVTSTGAVIADGYLGTAVLAQSQGEEGSTIEVNLDGVVKGGSGDATRAAAVRIEGGADNSIEFGASSFVYAENNQALLGTTGDDNATSRGILVGNINLGSGANRFTNAAGATFVSLATLDLGASGVFTNRGLLIPGGTVIEPPSATAASAGGSRLGVRGHVTQTTAVIGSLVFAPSSTLIVDVSYLSGASAGAGGRPDRSDLITVTGSATLAGTVTPSLSSLERVGRLTIINASSVANHGTHVTDTAAIDYSIALNGSQGDGTTIDLVAKPRFASLPGLNGNQTGVGHHINNILTGAGSASLGDLFALLGNMTDASAVASALDRLSPEGYAGLRVDTLTSTYRFADAMQRCRGMVTRETAEGCGWMQFKGTAYTRDASSQYKEMESSTFSYAGGVQVMLAPNWQLGLAGSYDAASLGVGPRFTSDGDRGGIGASLAYLGGLGRVSLSAIGAHTGYDSQRVIDISGELPSGRILDIGTAESDSGVSEAQLRLGLEMPFKVPASAITLTPTASVSGSYLYSHDARENGVGPYGVDIAGTGQWIYAGTAGLEISAAFPLGDGLLARPYARGGVLWLSEDRLGIDAALIGAPASAGTFTSFAGLDQVTGTVGAGVDIASRSTDARLQFGYEGAFGRESSAHAGMARLSVGF